MRLLVIGCGPLGLRVARLARGRGETVFASTRSPERAQGFAAEGLEPLLLDLTDPESIRVPDHLDALFLAVGYDRASGASRRAIYVDGLKHLLDRLGDVAPRFVYAGTTGVYGDHAGAWVDERDEPRPLNESGSISLEAERHLTAFAERTGAPTTILRFAGLYGPDRLFGLQRLRRDEPIPGDPSAFLNVIHLEDAARAALAAISTAEAPPLLLAADDDPPRRGDYYRLLAEQTGAPPPRFAPSPAGVSTRSEANKRIANRRLKQALGFALQYPDIHVGLPTAVAASTSI